MRDGTSSAWETILNAGKSNDANGHCQGVEKKQVEPGPAPEHEDDLIATTLQDMIANEIKSQAANALAIIPDTVGEAVEQCFHAAILVVKAEPVL